MLAESLFIDETGERDRLLWYQEAEDMDQVMEVCGEEIGEIAEEPRRLFEDSLVSDLDSPDTCLEPITRLIGPDR
jgi:hypothetical protein